MFIVSNSQHNIQSNIVNWNDYTKPALRLILLHISFFIVSEKSACKDVDVIPFRPLLCADLG